MRRVRSPQARGCPAEGQRSLSASSTCRWTAAAERQQEPPQAFVDAEADTGLDEADGGGDFLGVVSLDGRGGQPPRDRPAGGLDGETVAAGDGVTQGVDGQAEIVEAIVAALLLGGDMGGAAHGGSPGHKRPRMLFLSIIIHNYAILSSGWRRIFRDLQDCRATPREGWPSQSRLQAELPGDCG